MIRCERPHCGGVLLEELGRVRCLLCGFMEFTEDKIQVAYKRDLANAERGHLKPGRKLKERP